MIEGHYSTKYDVELTELNEDVLSMAHLVKNQMILTTDALMRNDSMLAQQVGENETLVNHLEVEIDSKSTEILARRQPTASDLRFVLMMIKTVNDLERIGDEINRVAMMGSRSFHSAGDTVVHEDVNKICQRVHKLLSATIEAFEQTDDTKALALIRTDKKVDKKFKNTLNHIIEWMMEEPDSIPEGVDILWVIRSLERIADRSCNICEHIIYFVKGKDLRHLDIDAISID